LRISLRSTWGWLGLAAFLVLPNCSLEEGGLMPSPHFNPGTQPWGEVIFCDIESNASTTARHCADPDEQSRGIPLTQAAVALVKGQSNNFALDYSPAAIAAAGCSPGQPVVITFLSPFPVGSSKCLNCGGVIGPVYTDVNAACVDVCRDMTGSDSFCADSSKIHKASTSASSCFNGACTGNALPATFADPRKTPEPVIWTSLLGVATSGIDSNTLTRTAATTGSFDAGAASGSTQLMTHGDGYVEFRASETSTGRMCGLSTGATDVDPTSGDMGFGINLNAAGGVRIFESGVAVPGPNPDTTWASYASGDRLRVSFADHFDGTATITYSVIPSSCSGPACSGTALRTVGGAAYPLRVDASFNQQGGTLTDVRIVRIK
jgi:hypothetical protein